MSEGREVNPAVLAHLGEHWVDEANFPGEFGGVADYARKMARRPLSFFVKRLYNLGLGGGRILDAGCGTGTWSFAMRGTFDQVCGVDYVTERVRLASHIAKAWDVPDVRFQSADITRLPFARGTFDALFCFGVIIVPQTRAEDALAEFARVVRPGGSVYVCLNAFGWARYLASSEAEPRRLLGRDGMYMALCKRFADIVERVGGSGGNGTPRATGSVEATDAASRVAEVCGEEYRDHFLQDLERIASGEARWFSPLGRTYPNTYEPEEVREIAEGLGFTRFRWGPEGSLQERAEPFDVKPIYAPEFEGRTAVWECLMEAP